MSNGAYGLIEVSGVTAAVDSLDAMCKAANVKLITWERKLGGRLVTIIIEGAVSDVTAAVAAADAACKREGLIMACSGVIANPSDEIRRIAELSAQRVQQSGLTIAQMLGY